jgi:hypothetical protein
MYRDEQIADVVFGRSQRRAVRWRRSAVRCVHAAKSNGSHDDASALLVLRRPWFTPLRSLAQRVLAPGGIGGANEHETHPARRALVCRSARKPFAETQSVIDPTEAIEPPSACRRRDKPGSGCRCARERSARSEQRRRAKAEARAQAARTRARDLRALEQARQAEREKAPRSESCGNRAAAREGDHGEIAAENDAAQRQAAVREAARGNWRRERRGSSGRDARQEARGAARRSRSPRGEAAARLIAAGSSAREASVKLAAPGDSARETRMSKAPRDSARRSAIAPIAGARVAAAGRIQHG